ncbi:MAG: DNA gyrase inhibitor YacG [Hyphomonadaceae bacterium]
MACPICSKPADPAYRPFCSKRCADVDLNRWLTGSYVMPGEESEDEEEFTQRRPGDAADEEDRRG